MCTQLSLFYTFTIRSDGANLQLCYMHIYFLKLEVVLEKGPNELSGESLEGLSALFTDADGWDGCLLPISSLHQQI